jgi:hypothetical protein
MNAAEKILADLYVLYARIFRVFFMQAKPIPVKR